MTQLGIGAMIHTLGGNGTTVNAVKAALGKKITSLKIDADANGGDGALEVGLDDGKTLSLYDAGRSCCESRFMDTEDDLSKFVGGTLDDIELRDGGETEEQYGDVSEILFCDVKTSKGVFQLATHNNHNGYYGGFGISASIE